MHACDTRMLKASTWPAAVMLVAYQSLARSGFQLRHVLWYFARGARRELHQRLRHNLHATTGQGVILHACYHRQQCATVCRQQCASGQAGMGTGGRMLGLALAAVHL